MPCWLGWPLPSFKWCLKSVLQLLLDFVSGSRLELTDIYHIYRLSGSSKMQHDMINMIESLNAFNRYGATWAVPIDIYKAIVWVWKAGKMFHLTGSKIVVLLMWKWMGMLLTKNHLLKSGSHLPKIFALFTSMPYKIMKNFILKALFLFSRYLNFCPDFFFIYKKQLH